MGINWDEIQKGCFYILTHNSLCNQDIEEEMKVKIIIPILTQSLKYNVFTDLRFEQSTNSNTRLDINVANNFIIECKKIRHNLSIRDEKQLFNYLLDKKINFGILTNGREWECIKVIGNTYEVFKTISFKNHLDINDKLFLDHLHKHNFNITDILNWRNDTV